MEFNINEFVYVRLTDFGKAELKRRWYELFNGSPPYDYVPPVEDENGWSKWQLWSLMSEMGESVRLGGKVPFEVNIKIEV